MKKGLYFLILNAVLLSVSYADDSEVILQRGPIKITMEDVDRYIIERVPAESKQDILNRDNIFREIVENLYTITVLGQEEELKARYDRPQLDWAMKLERDRRLMTLLLDNAAVEVLLSVDWDAAAKETYLGEDGKYLIPEKVHASHILVSTESRTEEEAMMLANEIRAQVLADIPSFGKIAKEKSEDPSAARNSGNLGFFARGQMVEVFENTAFAMSTPDEISDVVQSPFGYHIIQFHEQKPAEKKPFDEVQEEIINELKLAKANQIRQDIVIALRSDPELKWDDAQLEKLKQKYRVETPVVE